MSLQIPAFERARVLVVGDIMLDRYWSGQTSRISPEAPVPVVHVNGNEERPGGAANVALNIASLGGEAVLLGYVGNDEAGRSLESVLQQRGVQTRFVRLDNVPTITKLRVLSRHQQLIRLDFEEGFAGQDHAGLLANFRQLLADVDAVVLSDYRKGTLEQAQQLITLARAAGKPVVVDPKAKDFSTYQGATVITPNLAEFREAAGDWVGEADLVRRGQELLVRCELGNLLITRSEHGMTLLRGGQEPYNLPTRAREVYDVTGAGDTVVAVLTASMAAGLPVEQAMALANLAAGIVVGKVGTATVSVAELHKALQAHHAPLKGVVSEEQLLVAVQEARIHGERIVMTNGCFDILHIGHVTYLEEARKLGDRLIVAVNTDESVRALKGPTRPVNSMINRMKMLAALSCVDWVVDFSEDTPERLICAVKPDLLVKGGDNDPQKIPGNRCVWDNGGDVVVLGFVDGISTTNTIARIQNMEKES
ncbi:MAG: bifunctional D-glycero-beta-D-manno-heptose-7-phosphate kinase/D-glycero-beta-D-manno-heptose 1-phosphate adenylyltransferase HldE [Gammaproteobacteria bacterium]|nr:bifunctional D-glycero-beta-D-manno-heptose-7-phosphate kinase/D-glycero-beta-D-manno-heptose 1-phosphate adenylyltransferase HldE [Gammaproteobacteria bacterium]MBU1722352.1 bifunctional D-glycero-beta-D-manno-heptose-7-phosphate kinase/D-glycero-beta-D-manno-heptose 1-phosphate adenylyltransferase HldE [Gammaproteobacteria bacterium]MBU2004711.1 bifunctional D-glycero-beta-D-manno-heptose-7-phosphate kinase/D-glycero-beta-D-manno-heptose 1-phosphate adenylyltransferase HldE [Gammaproteobacte